ncbi:MAG: hypothetical protein ABI743_13985 [bacterium]
MERDAQGRLHELQAFEYLGVASFTTEWVDTPDGRGALVVISNCPGGSWEWVDISTFRFDPAARKLVQTRAQLSPHGNARFVADVGGYVPVVVSLEYDRWDEHPPSVPDEWQQFTVTFHTLQEGGFSFASRLDIEALLTTSEGRAAYGEKLIDLVIQKVRDDRQIGATLKQQMSGALQTGMGKSDRIGPLELDMDLGPGWKEIPVVPAGE